MIALQVSGKKKHVDLSLYLCFGNNVAMLTSFLLFKSYLVMTTILIMNFDIRNLSIRIIFLMRVFKNIAY